METVPGLLVGSGMDDVLGGLAELGYDAEWESIPAASVGAPHLRYRVWIIGTEQSGPLADAGSGWGSDDGLQAGRDESRPSGPNGSDTEGQRWSRRDESRPDLEHDGLQPPQLRSPVPNTTSNGRRPGRQGRLDPVGAGQPELALPAVADSDSPGRGEQRRPVSMEATLGPAERGGKSGGVRRRRTHGRIPRVRWITEWH
jgi:site-specific DNA-cytosine methylase